MTHRPMTILLILLCALPGTVRLVGAAEGGVSQEGKIRVLVVTGGHAFDERPFYDIFESIPDVAMTRATLPEAADFLRPELADRYDVVVFYDMWKEGFSPEQQNAFLELLNRGIGIVALHHTLAGHPKWPEYARIIGGRYLLEEEIRDGKKVPGSTFHHDQDIRVKIASPTHPITRGMRDFTIHDETYAGYDTDPGAIVLLTTDHPKSDPELAWAKTYGGSRVFTLQLGHDRRAYDHPNYRRLIAQGIRWTAGRTTDSKQP